MKDMNELANGQKTWYKIQKVLGFLQRRIFFLYILAR